MQQFCFILVLDPAWGRVGEKDVPTISVETRLLAIQMPQPIGLGGINWSDFTGLECKMVDPFCLCRCVNG